VPVVWMEKRDGQDERESPSGGRCYLVAYLVNR